MQGDGGEGDGEGVLRKDMEEDIRVKTHTEELGGQMSRERDHWWRSYPQRNIKQKQKLCFPRQIQTEGQRVGRRKK